MRYARIADHLGLGGETEAEKIQNLINAIETLKKRLNIPDTIHDYGIDETQFMTRVDSLAEEAFDDQCTGSNPRYPLIGEIRDLFVKAYYGA